METCTHTHISSNLVLTSVIAHNIEESSPKCETTIAASNAQSDHEIHHVWSHLRCYTKRNHSRWCWGINLCLMWLSPQCWDVVWSNHALLLTRTFCHVESPTISITTVVVKDIAKYIFILGWGGNGVMLIAKKRCLQISLAEDRFHYRVLALKGGVTLQYWYSHSCAMCEARVACGTCQACQVTTSCTYIGPSSFGTCHPAIF